MSESDTIWTPASLQTLLVPSVPFLSWFSGLPSPLQNNSEHIWMPGHTGVPQGPQSHRHCSIHSAVYQLQTLSKPKPLVNGWFCLTVISRMFFMYRYREDTKIKDIFSSILFQSGCGGFWKPVQWRPVIQKRRGWVWSIGKESYLQTSLWLVFSLWPEKEVRMKWTLLTLSMEASKNMTIFLLYIHSFRPQNWAAQSAFLIDWQKEVHGQLWKCERSKLEGRSPR